jgi:hypothetical protein
MPRPDLESSPDPILLVALALLTQDRAPLEWAARLARVSRDRQLVALADARLSGDAGLFDALVREHLADYPDQQGLATWLATDHHTTAQPEE